MAYELGYKGRPFERFELSADLYAHDVHGVRGFVPRLGPPGLINADIENVGNLWLYGAEFEARYAVTPKFKLLGNYTFERCDANLGLPFHFTDAITPPAHKFMIGAQYDVTDDLHLSAYTYYVSGVSAYDGNNPLLPQRIPPYVRLDLRAEYEFWKKHASVAVGVRNLTDPNHPEGGTTFLNNAEVPRMVYAEMRMKLD
jgi:outer membrane receptor protein involved in Fe transport